MSYRPQAGRRIELGGGRSLRLLRRCLLRHGVRERRGNVVGLVLVHGSAIPSALLDAVRNRGWIDGQNLIIEYRYAHQFQDRLPALAAELVALSPDLLIGGGGQQATVALKSAPTTAGECLFPLLFHGDAPECHSRLGPSAERHRAAPAGRTERRRPPLKWSGKAKWERSALPHAGLSEPGDISNESRSIDITSLSRP